MAKKKAAKKTARKATRKPKAIKRTTRKQPTVITVKPPMVDVTKEIKEDVVAVPKSAPAPTAPTTLPPKEAAALHEEFAQSLTQEPPKRGFWARLFGRK